MSLRTPDLEEIEVSQFSSGSSPTRVRPGSHPATPARVPAEGRAQARRGLKPTPRAWATILAVVLCAAATAEIVDRIAVSVGNSVITTSDLDRQIRLSSFLNGTAPDLSPAAKRTMADRMVEQTLIRKELDTSRYPMPSDKDIDADYQEFLAKAYPAPGALGDALARAGITEQDLKQGLVWQRAFTQFLDVRFRPGVQVTEEDIKQYFDTVVAPLARQAHPTEPLDLEDYREQIEAKLTGDRANKELDKWLSEAKRRTEIVFHEDALK